jgi:hypothetical protein
LISSVPQKIRLVSLRSLYEFSITSSAIVATIKTEQQGRMADQMTKPHCFSICFIAYREGRLDWRSERKATNMLRKLAHVLLKVCRYAMAIFQVEPIYRFR